MKKGYKLFVLLAVVACILIGGFLVHKFYFQKQSNPYLSDPTVVAIKDRGYLLVGSDVPYGTMEFFDPTGNIVGIDIDIAKKIADEIGVELKVKDYDFDELLSIVPGGGVDLAVSSITINPERSKTMLFSTPYFNGGQVIVVVNTNKSITEAMDLKDRNVAVQKETTAEVETAKYTNNVQIFGSVTDSDTSPNGAISKLKQGKVDAIMVDYIAGISIVKNNPDLKIVGSPITQEFYGIATRLENVALMGIVNDVLREMQGKGEIKAITDKWSKR